MKLHEIKYKKYGKVYTKKVACIYTVKKDGTKSKYPVYYDAYGSEQTQEDVLARLQKNNPNARFELA